MSARRNVLTSQMLPNPAPTAAAPVSTVSTVGASGSAGELLRARRCVAAIDMDCFYAQCEELRHPELKGRPVGVQQKALVITSNYTARACGVQKGDSLQVVKEKCPEITICNGEDLTFYGQVSQQFFDVAARFSSKVEKLGLDEVFVDLTEQVEERSSARDDGGAKMSGLVYPDAEAAGTDCEDGGDAGACWRYLALGSMICQEIREAIQLEVGLSSSAGVSVSKLLAKMVSSWKKPSQQTVFVPTADCLDSLLPESLPVQKIPGIGFASTQRCQVLGIHSIGQLRAVSHERLQEAFDASTVKTMKALCLGLDEAPVKASGAPKTCSAEDSFWQKPLSSNEEAKASLELLAQKLLTKIRMLERSFGPRPVPSLSLTVRHVDRAASGSAGPAAPDGVYRTKRRDPVADRSLGSWGKEGATEGDGDSEEALLERMVTRLVIDVRDSGKPFRRFKKWLEEQPPFDIVIDGANVGFNNQNREGGLFQYSQIDAVIDKLRETGSRVLLVLHPKWLREDADRTVTKRKKRNLDQINLEGNMGSSDDSAEDQEGEPEIQYPFDPITCAERAAPAGTPLAYIRKWKEAECLVRVPAKDCDDWYWLFAALSSARRGARHVQVVSNDHMRDHHWRMVGHRAFLKWQGRHMTRVSIWSETSDVENCKVTLTPPDMYSMQAQVSEDSSAWHFPVPLVPSRAQQLSSGRPLPRKEIESAECHWLAAWRDTPADR
ncbi:DNA polymerase iota (Rad30 homolog B) [Durusdinium trenchii]|uniref:DNA polymerase iota (Rad30 homolog B) n=1 Tax=Durusdinium trenchii TaxID=1381693 RepID=A0ABP0RI31_9DINO